MKEQQRRIDDLNTRMVRLETVLEIAQCLDGDRSPSRITLT